MEPKPLCTEKIDGKKVDIHVTGDGTFVARLTEDEGFSAPTKKALIEKLRERLRLERVAIEVSWTEHTWGRGSDEEYLKIIDGTLVGLHATNNDYLLRRLDGKGDRARAYHALLRRTTPEEKARFAALQQAIRAAEKAFETFKKSLEVDGRALLAAAQSKEKS